MHQYFTAQDQLGIISIKENTTYKTERSLFERVMPIFINDLKNMFHI